MGRTLPMYAPQTLGPKERVALQLENRASLPFRSNTLEAISRDLARSAAARREFITAPAAYLAREGAPVQTATVMNTEICRTSEACSAANIAICIHTVYSAATAIYFAAVYAYVFFWKDIGTAGVSMDAQPGASVAMTSPFV